MTTNVCCCIIYIFVTDNQMTMTKISKKSAYPIKTPVVQDYFVGTDSEGNLKTVNFKFESVAALINELNGVPILNYMFKTDSNIALEVLTEGVFLSLGNETIISNATKLYLNKKNFNRKDLTQLFRFISDNKTKFLIKLENSSNPYNSVYLNIDEFTEFQDYFTIDISSYLSNVYLASLVHFNIYFFSFVLKASTGSGGSSTLPIELTNEFIWVSGPQVFTIPTGAKIQAVFTNQGSFLKRSEFSYTTTELTIIKPLRTNDRVTPIGYYQN